MAEGEQTVNLERPTCRWVRQTISAKRGQKDQKSCCLLMLKMNLYVGGYICRFLHNKFSVEESFQDSLVLQTVVKFGIFEKCTMEIVSLPGLNLKRLLNLIYNIFSLLLF